MNSKIKYIVDQYKNMQPEERRALIDAMLEQNKLQRKKPAKIGLLSDYTTKARDYYKNFGKMNGLSTGYKNLDKLTLGLAKGELIVIAGKTSEGKTTLATNIANNIALNGTTVLFVTLEQTKEEITSRYMYINGGENENYHKVAGLTAVQEELEISYQSIDNLISTAVEQMNVGLVVIDHLHYLTRELEHIVEDIGRITKEFKKSAIKHDIPIILISHVRKTENIMATIDDLRGSSYIAQDADIVLMVGRDPTLSSKMLIRIEKNRNRGFDRENDTAELYTDRIKLTETEQEKIYNLKALTMFEGAEKEDNINDPFKE